MKAGIEALRWLTQQGYRFEVVGEELHWQWVRPGRPDPQFRDPLEVVKEHKADVVRFLTSCQSCPQYVLQEVEAGFPAFCLYHKEGLLTENPVCRDFWENHITREEVSCHDLNKRLI